MDPGDWVALAAAIVALLAMGVAIWQAVEARKAREVANDQAASAQTAAVAAERSAAAAEEQAEAQREQVEIMRQQHARDQEARDRPEFDVRPSPDWTGTGAMPLDIIMTSGQDLRRLDIEVAGSAVRGVHGAPASLVRGGSTVIRDNMTRNASTRVWVDAKPGATVTVKLTGTSVDNRTWDLLPREIRIPDDQGAAE